MVSHESDYVIVGGGLTGLTAGAALGDHAIVLEQSDRPGGLVQSDDRSGYWFDRVLHILHVSNLQTEHILRRLPDLHLESCSPQAWVETVKGRTRYPIQMHLGQLPDDVVVSCLQDLAEMTYRCSDQPVANFEEWLQRTFGRSLCELFLFPYNRKLWKRPLCELAPNGFRWTITPPDYGRVLLGSLQPETEFDSYNSRAFYPRPPAGSSVRGMEVLIRSLVPFVPRLELGHELISLDVDKRVATVRHSGQIEEYSYRDECLCTIPLPLAIQLCKQAPPSLREGCKELKHNRVVMARFSLRGPRPVNRGHWCYYSDESIVFSRLIYMHEFDTACAPQNGWSVMAEIVEPAEAPLASASDICARVRRDMDRSGIIPEDCQIIDEDVIVADPAYVVFTSLSHEIVADCIDFFDKHGVTVLGRYGRWEYSSMFQVFQDALKWAQERGGSLDSHLESSDSSNDREVA